MSILITPNNEFIANNNNELKLRCPSCDNFDVMSPQALPAFEKLISKKPKTVGGIYECNVCLFPIFLKFNVISYKKESIKLSRAYTELKKPKEKFSFVYLPDETAEFFKEALSCYSENNLNAFAYVLIK